MKTTLSGVLLAAFAVGICIQAHAAQRVDHGDRRPGQSLAAQQRKAIAAAIRKSHRQPPSTEKQALATLVRSPSGAVEMQVPTSLWNTLSVQRDAQGAEHVHERSGVEAAPENASEGPANE